MDYLAHGWSPEDMCRHYSHLTPAEAHAAMSYYYDHQEEIDAEIKSELSESRATRAAMPPTPFEVRMHKDSVL
jgi:hypothetical protein